MKARIVSLTVALAASLCACATSGDTASPATVQRERLESWAKLCEGRGFARGTSDFNDCVMGYDREATNPPVR